jgi:hypothetical protein
MQTHDLIPTDFGDALAATSGAASGASRIGGVLLATLALPGLAALCTLAAPAAHAENAPEHATVAVSYGDYRDGQPGWDRVHVKAPQVYVQVPVAGQWSVEGAWVGDSVSGATPRMHTQRSGASVMHDDRSAVDVKVTRYLDRSAYSASLSHSDEHDYTSQALGLEGRWSSDDNNRTWSLGYGGSYDTINSTNNVAINQHKRTRELMGGVTQVLTPSDIAQVNLTRSVGTGYYDDPYKLFDQRPGQRNAWIGLLRWNHALESYGAALHSSYRYHSDSFGVRSHTLGLEWVQPTGAWTFTPGVRYTTQSAAKFYVDPVLNAQGQDDMLWFYKLTGNKSADQRLAAWGAITLSLKASYAVTPDTSVSVKLERYRQSAALRLGGGGSPGLDPFHAQFIQVGLTHRF